MSDLRTCCFILYLRCFLLFSSYKLHNFVGIDVCNITQAEVLGYLVTARQGKKSRLVTQLLLMWVVVCDWITEVCMLSVFLGCPCPLVVEREFLSGTFLSVHIGISRFFNPRSGPYEEKEKPKTSPSCAEGPTQFAFFSLPLKTLL